MVIVGGFGGLHAAEALTIEVAGFEAQTFTDRSR
jgi:hypothetical protein